MLKWIRSALIGTDSAVDDSAPSAWKSRLAKYLSPVDKQPGSRAGLALDIERYVLTGEPSQVMHEVASLQSVAAHLKMTGYSYERDGDTVLVELYEDVCDVPPIVMLRWARLLEAAATQNSRACYALAFPGDVHWPEALLMHTTGRSIQGWTNIVPKPRGISMDYMEAIFVAAGLEPDALLRSAFQSPVNSGFVPLQRLPLASLLDGYAVALHRHIDVIRPLLLNPSVPQRLHMISMLNGALDETLVALAEEISELAVSGSKQVRLAIDPLVRRAHASTIEVLKRLAKSGKSEQRMNSLRLLWTLAREQNRDVIEEFARNTASADAAPTIQLLVDEWDGRAAALADAVEYDYTVPQIAWATEPTPGLIEAIERLWRDMNQGVDEANKQARAHYEWGKSKGHSWPLNQTEPFTEAKKKALLQYLASPEPLPAVGSSTSNWNVVRVALASFAGEPAVSPVVLAKTVHFIGPAGVREALNHALIDTINVMHARTGRPTLLEFCQIAAGLGFDARAVMHAYCRSWSSLAGKWSSDAVWPFFAHHRDLLVQALAPAARDYYFDRQRVYTAIASLPRPPEEVVNAMFDLALGTAKTERPLAQAALANLPGKEARIINALSDGRGEVRAVAALWLTSLRHEAAIPALEAATIKEKNDLAKGAMLDALQAFGKPVEAYLDRKALLKDAAKTVAKGAPKDVEWFPWGAIPSVRWADSGDYVDPQILQWMIVQAVKQKTPEPNAILRKYCGMFEPRGREAFGQFVLEAWLAEDTRTVSLETAMQGAQQRANALFNAANQPAPQPTGNTRYDEYVRQAYEDNVARWGGRSIEQITAMLLPGYQRILVGSAIASKGLLAIAAACCAERAATPVGRYLKEYYGARAAHGKALIAMLAWIEHPSATQLMLSVGNRFRTKSFQEEATKQAEALAERKGWTMAELADRTIPSGGFDESGMLELSYGERTFTAKLLPDFKVELYNPDGKKIAALPEPRTDDDADMAKLS
ncbi:MAG: hypothetical protein JO002_03545, partial [Burkholderiaceae bacterium]|nr:hypothetical protein [Burkholderiaceae bacterium]